MSGPACSHCGLYHPDGVPERLLAAGHPYLTSHPTRRGFATVARIGGRTILDPADPLPPPAPTVRP